MATNAVSKAPAKKCWFTGKSEDIDAFIQDVEYYIAEDANADKADPLREIAKYIVQRKS